MYHRGLTWLLSGLAACAVIFAVSPPARADTQQPENKGLFITPLRDYISVDPGKIQNRTITIANITDKPMSVTLSVAQFSVADYTYDYQFTAAEEDWIKLGTPEVELQPGKSSVISYSIAPPAATTPGGHYFTLFATTSAGSPPGSKVQAATVLYVTVNGTLDRSSTVRNTTIPHVAFGSNIPFSLTVKDTGNTHFLTYTSGELSGFSNRGKAAETTHILLPSTTRTLSSSIPAPLLPGVYKATYGYRIDDGQTVQRSAYVVYLPPWSVAIPIGIGGLALALRRRQR